MTALHDAIHEMYRRLSTREDRPRMLVIPASWSNEQIEFCRSVINGAYVKATLDDDPSRADAD